ncbi:CYTH domain-containing protein [Rhizobium acidisoli]|nr:CYTH domain-containing protein [Rhizobium acidisoli]
MRYQANEQEEMLASEIELKLELTPEAVEAAIGSGLLGEPTSILQQTSTYFDTADRKLFDRGFTLRIRKTGNSLIQTVKATGESASLFARSELRASVTAGHKMDDEFSLPLSRLRPCAGCKFPLRWSKI